MHGVVYDAEKAKKGTRITFVTIFCLLFVAAMIYWFYMLYEINKLNDLSVNALTLLENSGSILKDTMKQNAAFQGMIVSAILIFSVDYIWFK